jgi:hypothetical protein
MARSPLDHLRVPSTELENEGGGRGVSVQQLRGLSEQARSRRIDDLAVFRCVFYDCLTLRADALFELTDAVLCADGPSVGTALTIPCIPTF